MHKDIESSRESVIKIKLSGAYAKKAAMSLTRILRSMDQMPDDTQKVLIDQGVVDHLLSLRAAIDHAEEK